ncbi:MAG: hypothetical protein ONB23_07155 [candidate division KSB1 bacterium]|nr:hypothetical protein [candidate division KSB1 bacterium]
MSRRLASLLGILGVSLLVPISRAQVAVTLYTGLYLPQPTDLLLRQDAWHTDLWLRDVPLRGRSLQSPFYYGIRVGKRVRSRGRSPVVELEFVHAKAYARESERVNIEGRWKGMQVSERGLFSRYVRSFSLSHGLNLLLGNVFYPLVHNRVFAMGLRAGAGAAIPHVEDCVDGHWVQRYEMSGLCLQVGLGGAVKLSRAWSADVSARCSAARLSRMSAYGGSLQANIWGVHLDVGVSRAFSSRAQR